MVIRARDGNIGPNGLQQFCVVTAASTFYTTARALLVSGGDGTQIRADKVPNQPTGNNCTLLRVQKTSIRMN